MGYFANSTEGEMYERKYCEKCFCYQDGHCPCLQAHMLWNYDECNNDDSLLHKMIPREGVANNRCIFWEPKEDKEEGRH